MTLSECDPPDLEQAEECPPKEVLGGRRGFKEDDGLVLHQIPRGTVFPGHGMDFS